MLSSIHLDVSMDHLSTNQGILHPNLDTPSQKWLKTKWGSQPPSPIIKTCFISCEVWSLNPWPPRGQKSIPLSFHFVGVKHLEKYGIPLGTHLEHTNCALFIILVALAIHYREHMKLNGNLEEPYGERGNKTLQVPPPAPKPYKERIIGPIRLIWVHLIGHLGFFSWNVLSTNSPKMDHYHQFPYPRFQFSFLPSQELEPQDWHSQTKNLLTLVWNMNMTLLLWD